MKIICIGRNYKDHAAEMGSEVPKNPMIFMKPPTALLINNKPLYYPEFTKDLHYEGEIVLKVCNNGRHIEPQFAHKYFDKIGFGFDFTARDLQQQCKEKGHPWEIAKGFDNSAGVSKFIPTKDLPSLENIHFETKLNGESVQKGETKHLIFPFNDLICYISKFFKLQIGDFIFTGTPAGVGPLKIGDKLQGFIEGNQMISIDIK